MSRLPAYGQPSVIVADRFKVRFLRQFVALLTYR